jgi:hypothetical protein
MVVWARMLWQDALLIDPMNSLPLFDMMCGGAQPQTWLWMAKATDASFLRYQ